MGKWEEGSVTLPRNKFISNIRRCIRGGDSLIPSISELGVPKGKYLYERGSVNSLPRPARGRREAERPRGRT